MKKSEAGTLASIFTKSLRDLGKLFIIMNSLYFLHKKRSFEI